MCLHPNRREIYNNLCHIRMQTETLTCIYQQGPSSNEPSTTRSSFHGRYRQSADCLDLLGKLAVHDQIGAQTCQGLRGHDDDMQVLDHIHLYTP